MGDTGKWSEKKILVERKKKQAQRWRRVSAINACRYIGQRASDRYVASLSARYKGRFVLSTKV